MKCVQCGHATKSEKVPRYHYTECGLKNVYLNGLSARVCPECGETEVTFPNIEQLHGLIAGDLAVQAARLRPEEIRFLRVHLGFSGADFARKIGVTPSAVSRWENGKDQMEIPTERYLRVLILSKAGPFRDYDHLQDYGSKKVKARQPLEFSSHHGSDWKQLAA